MKEQCNREDIEALLIANEMWSVDEDGNAVDYLDTAHSDGDLVDEYVCRNCGEYFTPKKAYDYAAIAEAWQKTLAHLQQQEVAS